MTHAPLKTGILMIPVVVAAIYAFPGVAAAWAIALAAGMDEPPAILLLAIEMVSVPLIVSHAGRFIDLHLRNGGA